VVLEGPICHVHALSCAIGQRGTGSAGERQAADYAAAQLEKLGLLTERLTCRTIVSMNHYPLSINALALLGVILYPLGGGGTRWVAACLALLAASFMTLTIRTSWNPLRAFLPKLHSPSVLSHIEPASEVRGQAVLLAHLDTNKARIAWKPSRLRWLEPLTYLTLAVQGSLGLLYLWGAVSGWRWGAWLLSLLPTLYILATCITLLLDDRSPYTCGANDNAASVGVALHLAAHLTHRPLQHTRLWLAFTGAEETDHYGLRSILKAHPQDMRQALFIDLEGVGGGEMVYVTRHGIGLHYYPDPELLNLTARVAQEHPEWSIRGAKMCMSEEVSTLTLLGHRAVCIAGRDPVTGGLPHWHQADDTCDTIDQQTLQKAFDFTLVLLQQLDQKA